MLLGPHVEKITIRFDGEALEDPRPLQALRSIPHRCPQLSCLDIHGCSVPREFLDTITELVPALENITHFRMPFIPIPMATLRAVAFLPSLMRLHIALTGEYDNLAEGLVLSPGANRPFNRLVQLYLKATSPEQVLQLLALVASRCLIVLQVRYEAVLDAQRVEALFTALACHPCRRKLHGLSLEAFWDPPTISTPRLTISTFTPLFKLHLRSLTLDHFLVDVDDEGLAAMAHAWPNLNHLTLGAQIRWGSDHPSRATIFGLLALVEGCPRIEHIGYHVHTSVLRSQDRTLFSRPGNGIMTDRPITLEVTDSRIHDSVEMASFSSDICPKLYIDHLWEVDDEAEEDELEGADIDDEEDMRKKWDEVVEYIPHLALVRRRERLDPARLRSR
ncbi:hypothetical protein C8Q72DRAFT_833729 [Fomitopsis betulina]|nr:hypothetical protein C8Q72DRAFT_833729 [Fomitopsis betulina]